MSEELPPGWAEITLSDLGLPATPKIDPQRSATETFELYSVPSFDTEAPELALGKSIASTRQAVEPGDVLLCKINPRINRVWIVAPRSRHRQIASTEWVVVRPHGHEPRFFMWQMRAEEFRERLLDDVSGVGGSLMRARTVGIEKLRLRVPPVAEQRRIVARIEALFARIRQARADLLRITSLSERYRLTVLRAALRGELTADWRSRVGALEPAERLVARTPAPSQPRGGREATDEVIPGVAALSVNHPRTEPPPGWTWVPLLRLARQESGHTPSRSVAAYWNGDIPWIGIRDAGAHHGGVIQDTAQHVTQAGLDNSSARLLPAQTVCLSRTASVGYVVVMGRPMATSQDFVTWTCSSALLPDFLKYALLAEGDDIRRFGKGSTHTTIYFPEIRALHICLPPLAEQHEIVRLLDQALTAVGNATHDADRAYILLDHLERSILTRAFRGDLVPQDPADEPAAVTLPCAEIRSAPRGRQRGARAATYREIMADG